jgi:lipopolysaccharide transport system ATP-binding protein
VGFDNHREGINLDITCYVKNADELLMFESGFVLSSERDSERSTYRVRGTIPGRFLNAGHYSLTVQFGQDQRHLLYRHENVVSFAVEVSGKGRGHNLRTAPGVMRPLLAWERLGC